MRAGRRGAAGDRGSLPGGSGGLLCIAGLALLSQCGDGSQASSLRTLSATDVTNLPAGDAVGSAFSGLFRLSGSTLRTGCECRVGSCDAFESVTAASFEVTQVDGTLHVLSHWPSNDSAEQGGIDSNGEFMIGGTLQQGQAVWRTLTRGAIIAGVSLDASADTTIVGSVAGVDYDCDVQATFTSTYVAAL